MNLELAIVRFDFLNVHIKYKFPLIVIYDSSLLL